MVILRNWVISTSAMAWWIDNQRPTRGLVNYGNRAIANSQANIYYIQTIKTKLLSRFQACQYCRALLFLQNILIWNFWRNSHLYNLTYCTLKTQIPWIHSFHSIILILWHPQVYASISKNHDIKIYTKKYVILSYNHSHPSPVYKLLWQIIIFAYFNVPFYFGLLTIRDDSLE